jgi:hypothetical protein
MFDSFIWGIIWSATTGLIIAFFHGEHDFKRIEKIATLSGESVKILHKCNTNFLIFNGIVFLASTGGIIELLPIINECPCASSSYYRFALLLIFIGLSSGMVYSILSCFSIYRGSSIIMRSGKLGDELRDYALKCPALLESFIIHPIQSKIAEIIIISLICIILFIFGSNLIL